MAMVLPDTKREKRYRRFGVGTGTKTTQFCLGLITAKKKLPHHGMQLCKSNEKEMIRT